MNIAAMAVITLIVFAEKTLPWGRLAPRATAAAPPSSEMNARRFMGLPKTKDRASSIAG